MLHWPQPTAAFATASSVGRDGSARRSAGTCRAFGAHPHTSATKPDTAANGLSAFAGIPDHFAGRPDTLAGIPNTFAAMPFVAAGIPSLLASTLSSRACRGISVVSSPPAFAGIPDISATMWCNFATMREKPSQTNRV